MHERRAEFQQPGRRAPEVSRLGAAAWKALSGAERIPYQKAFDTAQAKFKADMAAFIADGGVKKKGMVALRNARRRRMAAGGPMEGDLIEVEQAPHVTAKGLRQPKKPTGGAFGMFLREKRADFQQSGRRAPEVSKMVSVAWKALSEAERTPYHEAFQTSQAKYKSDMAAFIGDGGVKQKGVTALRKARMQRRRLNAKALDDGSCVKETRKRKREDAQELDEDDDDVPVGQIMKKVLTAPAGTEAKQFDQQVKLKALLTNPKIMAKNLGASVVLKALQDANGSVVAARKSLLG